MGFPWRESVGKQDFGISGHSRLEYVIRSSGFVFVIRESHGIFAGEFEFGIFGNADKPIKSRHARKRFFRISGDHRVRSQDYLREMRLFFHRSRNSVFFPKRDVRFSFGVERIPEFVGKPGDVEIESLFVVRSERRR